MISTVPHSLTVLSVLCQLSSDAPASPSAVSSPSLTTKRFSCRICMESFHGRSDMENHKRAHVDASTFKCPDCDFTSTSWPEVKVSLPESHSTKVSLKYVISKFSNKRQTHVQIRFSSSVCSKHSVSGSFSTCGSVRGQRASIS